MCSVPPFLVASLRKDANTDVSQQVGLVVGAKYPEKIYYSFSLLKGSFISLGKDELLNETCTSVRKIKW